MTVSDRAAFSSSREMRNMCPGAVATLLTSTEQALASRSGRRTIVVEQIGTPQAPRLRPLILLSSSLPASLARQVVHGRPDMLATIDGRDVSIRSAQGSKQMALHHLPNGGFRGRGGGEGPSKATASAVGGLGIFAGPERRHAQR